MHMMQDFVLIPKGFYFEDEFSEPSLFLQVITQKDSYPKVLFFRKIVIPKSRISIF